ncbi:engulfment and cell motility ELM family protein [Trypanosoma grayi]|uniref:engulfment and cell motility ELM family protein n=1 Tax=Trypanosoma grayi TaxID=71804 RepID=UPI0004F47C93|nr:engulfment and cell motility ELM family protein [Trypanosoma grayi]KEG12467.1 engulfment and cell motility ELM family protein [Trypanosoma grayi]
MSSAIFPPEGHTGILAAVIGAGGIVVFLYCMSRRRGPSSRRRRCPPVLRGINAGERPELATKLAIDHIAKGEIATLGELLGFFRGKDAKRVRIEETLLKFLRHHYPAEAAPSAGTPVKYSGNVRARRMLQQLRHCAEQAARLEEERATPFDATNPDHARMLQELWAAAGKSSETFAPHNNSEWGDLGFQGRDPTTDLRGGGVLALRQLLHFAQTHNSDFLEMMAFNKKILAAGEHCWYLLAVVSIQFTAQLLLQQDHKFYLPQLEVLYDTVKSGGENDDEAGRHVGDMRAAVLERRSSSCKGGDDKSADDAWEQESDFEAGFFTLHHQLLLHFKTCWHRDLPHVMEYGNYMPAVFQSFFLPD